MEGSPQIALAGLALLWSCVLGLYVGVRTLLVWRGTRGTPELAIGINVLSISIGGVLFAAFTASPGFAEAAIGTTLRVVMVAMLVVHQLALAIGSWRIFRPNARWPLLVVAWVAGMMFAVTILVFQPHVAPADRSELYEATRLVLLLWTTWECFRYRALLVRRVRLGLAEPMIAHRIGLWGVAGVVQIVSCSLPLLALVVHGVPLFSEAVILYVTSVLAIVGSTSIALAFFPPAAYVRRVERLWAATAAA